MGRGEEARIRTDDVPLCVLEGVSCEGELFLLLASRKKREASQKACVCAVGGRARERGGAEEISRTLRPRVALVHCPEPAVGTSFRSIERSNDRIMHQIREQTHQLLVHNPRYSICSEFCLESH